MPHTRGECGKASEKLIEAALSAWESDGAEEVSARSLTSTAGLPVSAIHYHFGGLGQLLDAAQDAAVTAAQAWCSAQRAAIGGDATSPAMLGPLLATLIDDWCETQRRIAFAWREGQLMALRDPGRATAATRWTRMWEDFFTGLCGELGCARFSTPTAWFFDGASALHMLRWRRPLDRSALEELCGGWASWLTGRLAPAGHWFAAGQEAARRLAAKPDPADELAESIADAAARVVAQSGVTALTHRAVAAAAKVTLGTVSYKYRTRADLGRAAFDSIYRRVTSSTPTLPDQPAAMSAAEAVSHAERSLPSRTDRLGFGELCVAAGRDPALGAFVPQLRYLRGQGSGRILDAVLGGKGRAAPIDGAILSAVLGGRGPSSSSPGDNEAGPLARLLEGLANGGP